MEDVVTNFLAGIGAQLPLLIVYVAGLITVQRQRFQHPVAAQRVSLAIMILLLDATVLHGLGIWLPTAALSNDISYAEIGIVVYGLALVRSLLRAWAFILLLGAIFPVETHTSCLIRLVGGVLGLVVGTLLAIAAGDPIGAAMGVSSFEGARGYFVAFVLIPLFAAVGAGLGVLMTYVPRRAR
jgi:hypothetical protein